MVKFDATFDDGTEDPNKQPTEAQNQDPQKPTEAQNQDAGTPDPETPGSGTEDQKKPINQEAVDRKIGKITAKRREAEDKAAETQRLLDEANERLKQYEETPEDIVIPDLPDPYDPEYTQKVAERDEAIRKKAQADADAKVAQEAEQARIEKEQQDARQRYLDQTTAMYEAAEKAGIKKDDFQKAEQTLSLFVKDPGLAQYILGHENSALIVNELANDVETLDKISRMPGTAAAVIVATQVLPKALKFKPSVPNAPDPLDVPKGKPGGEKDPYLDGVQFE